MARLHDDKIVYTYIDGANLHQAFKAANLKLNYDRFRVWLSDKYHVSKVFLFIGYIAKNKPLYSFLEKVGYILIYKEVTTDPSGKIKGNCDAELVLNVMRDYYEDCFSRAIIISSDGDFSCLVSFLHQKNALSILMSPYKTCSYLLRKLNIPILYLHCELKNTLVTIAERAPG